MPRSSPPRNTAPGLACASCRSQWAHSIGVVVSDTSKEMPTATVSVTENSRNSRPTMPPINKIGTNTATKDRLIDSTVKPTSLTPAKAACSGLKPRSSFWLTFSTTTIASSTTKPVAIIIAIKDMLFKL